MSKVGKQFSEEEKEIACNLIGLYDIQVDAPDYRFTADLSMIYDMIDMVKKNHKDMNGDNEVVMVVKQKDINKDDENKFVANKK